MALLTDSGPQAHTHSAETLVPDQSRAERTRSWEVADFPVPQGREEDWRFTPVGRLAELFTDEGGSATLSVEHDLPQGVTRTQVPAAEARTAGVPLPADRAAAVAASGDSVVVIDV
ncbi:Fe-S cluster assembly protein SufD, partial [Janibacter sp. RAF20_2_2]